MRFLLFLFFNFTKMLNYYANQNQNKRLRRISSFYANYNFENENIIILQKLVKIDL